MAWGGPLGPPYRSAFLARGSSPALLEHMKTLFPLVAVALAMLSSALGAGDRGIRVRPIVPNGVEERFVPAAFEEQTLTGLLGDRMRINLDERLLAGVDLDVILKGYRR